MSRAVSRLVKGGGNIQAKLNPCLADLCRALVACLGRFAQTSASVVTECCRALVYLMKNVSDDLDDAKSYHSVSGGGSSGNMTRPMDAPGLQTLLGGLGLCRVIGSVFASILGRLDPASGLTSSADR